MQIINSGGRLEIYPNGLSISDNLPVGSYAVRADDNGYFLVGQKSFVQTEKKVYGRRDDKVNKVLRGYEAMNRSVGVILSGDKGIGKSLFSRMLSMEVAERYNMPTIIVDTAYNGVGKFLATIEQECLILFDEFEKVFDGQRGARQEELLSFFDGISQQKHLFVVTSNSVSRLNDFLVNRPGRFHYHVRFEYPTAVEIKEYLEDHLAKDHHQEINKVIRLASMMDLNYDCLRAISTEINFGLTLNEALQDLNILRIGSTPFNILIKLKDGTELVRGYNADGNSRISSGWDNVSGGNGEYSIRSIDVSLLDAKYMDEAFVISSPSADQLLLTIENDDDDDEDTFVPQEDIEAIWFVKRREATPYLTV